MLHRAATLLIVAFWLTMTGFLVRSEFVPEGSRMREVPVAHVLNLLFQSDRGSDLNITGDGGVVGRFNLRPHFDREADTRTLSFDSGIQLRAKDARQRIKLDGEMRFDPTMQIQRCTIALTLFEAVAIKTEVTIEPPANRGHVAIYSQVRPKDSPVRLQSEFLLIEEHDFTLDQAGARELLSLAQLDPALLATAQVSELKPHVRARSSSLLLHGERVETYLLMIEQGGQTVLEMHVSQLGNVLQAKALNCTLAPDDITP